MARPNRLSAAELETAVTKLPGWQVREGKLCKDFRFPDFRAAFAFMTRCALAAESLDHHPDWSNVYNRVSVSLVTHDVGGVTALDLELAALMEAYAGSGAR
jgi:4a-hydroxytetrahydrobiopterin dehydratase